MPKPKPRRITDVVSAARVRLGPGEVLLVRLPAFVTPAQAERVRDIWLTGFQKAGVTVDARRILIMLGDVEVAVVAA